MPRIQSAKIFSGGKRVGTAQNLTYTITTGDTQELADSGPYNTDGITITEVSCDTIMPVGGIGVSWFQQAIDHEDLDLTMGIIDGKLHSLKECRCKTIEVSSEMASGKQTGKFAFHGGKPSLT